VQLIMHISLQVKWWSWEPGQGQQEFGKHIIHIMDSVG